MDVQDRHRVVGGGAVRPVAQGFDKRRPRQAYRIANREVTHFREGIVVVLQTGYDEAEFQRIGQASDDAALFAVAR